MRSSFEISKPSFGMLSVIVGIILTANAGYGAHDLTCCEMIEPSNQYIEADWNITPTLRIANLGETVDEFFRVKFLAVDEAENDTVFVDSTFIGSMGPYPDSLEVIIWPWIPEGRCAELQPFVHYELLGVVCLDADENPANDTILRNVTCLLSHDVGVVDITLDPAPDSPPDHYNAGTEITVTATVENFGYNGVHPIDVHCDIIDKSVDPEEVVYRNVQSTPYMNWRGNETGEPFIAEVEFPVFTISNEGWHTVVCYTDLIADNCEDNDSNAAHVNSGIEEVALPVSFSLEVSGLSFGKRFSVDFTVPHRTWIRLDVFDVDGRWVESIANDIFEAGSYDVEWDGCDAAGRKVAAGVYLIRMQADEFKAVQKIVIMN